MVIAKCLTPPISSFSLQELPSQQIVDTRSNAPVQAGIVGKQTQDTEELHSFASPGSTSTTPTIGGLGFARTETESIEQQSKANAEFVPSSTPDL